MSGMTPVAFAATTPATATAPVVRTEAMPIPRILPASSELGRTQARRISTIRLDFSSTTPWAMNWPPPMMANSSRTSIVMRIA